MSEALPDSLVTEPAESTAMPLAMTFWGTVSIAVFCALVVLVMGLSAYHFLSGGSNKARFAVVDLPGILELQQLHLYRRLNDQTAGETSKQTMLAEAQRFGGQLEAALVRAKQECNCILLVKSAVVLPDLPDATPGVAQALGLGGLNVQDLRQSLQKELSMPALPANVGKP